MLVTNRKLVENEAMCISDFINKRSLRKRSHKRVAQIIILVNEWTESILICRWFLCQNLKEFDVEVDALVSHCFLSKSNGLDCGIVWEKLAYSLIKER